MYLLEGQICNKYYLKRINLNIKIYSKGENVLEKQSKKIENLSKSNDKYELKVGDMTVEIVYSKNNKSFNECMLNILKQKT